VLGALAVILFGPDKLPQAALSAARLIEHVKAVRRDAVGQLGDALDPQTRAALREGLEVKTALTEQLGELAREGTAAAAAAGEVRDTLAQLGEKPARPHPLAPAGFGNSAAERPVHTYGGDDLP
jgi:Sec-independent protein translocase protein TatA